MLFETMSTILGELAQGPVSSDAIQDIVDFETSLAQVVTGNHRLHLVIIIFGSRTHVARCMGSLVEFCSESLKYPIETLQIVMLVITPVNQIICFVRVSFLFQIWEDTTDLTVADVYNSIYTVQQLYSLWPYVRMFLPSLSY